MHSSENQLERSYCNGLWRHYHRAWYWGVSTKQGNQLFLPLHKFSSLLCREGNNSEDFYIYVADFGNNMYNRQTFPVYRFKEPTLEEMRWVWIGRRREAGCGKTFLSVPISFSFIPNCHSVSSLRTGEVFIPREDVTKIDLTTENAPKEDHETLMLDPMTNDLYLVSKNHEQPLANIYKFTPPKEFNHDTIVMKSLGIIGGNMMKIDDPPKVLFRCPGAANGSGRRHCQWWNTDHSAWSLWNSLDVEQTCIDPDRDGFGHARAVHHGNDLLYVLSLIIILSSTKEIDWWAPRRGCGLSSKGRRLLYHQRDGEPARLLLCL